MIPKQIHQIWVGDERKCPHEWLATWRDKHPGWEYRLWGNDDLKSFPWVLKAQIERLAKARKWQGVSDLMRYEILMRFGGVYTDADSVCLEPLDDLLGYKAFAAYENDAESHGLVANGTIGCVPEHPIMRHLVGEMKRRRNPLRSGLRRLPFFQRKREPVFKAVGPFALTKAIKRNPDLITILPSYSFYPLRHDGTENDVNGKCYAKQFWGSTTGAYRTTGYVEAPIVPVNLWKQREALELVIMSSKDAPEDHLNALRAAYQTISAAIDEL